MRGQARSSITVLAYHRVELPAHGTASLSPDLVEATPAQFEAQMRYLSAHYNVVSPHDLVRALRGGYRLPPRALAVTFDDGYHSFLETAMPVLRRLALPAGLFVVTGHAERPETPFWWDELYRALFGAPSDSLHVEGLGEIPLRTHEQRERAYERIVPVVERAEARKAERLVEEIVAQSGVAPRTEKVTLDWEEIRALADEGVAIGPHTRTHPLLSRVGPSQLRDEIFGSWDDLRRHVPGALPLFCYPNGKPHAISPLAIQAVKEAGLAGGFTMVAGLNVVGRTDPYTLHRVGLEPGESLRRLTLKLTAAGRLYRQVKRLAMRAKPAKAGG